MRPTPSVEGDGPDLASLLDDPQAPGSVENHETRGVAFHADDVAVEEGLQAAQRSVGSDRGAHQPGVERGKVQCVAGTLSPFPAFGLCLRRCATGSRIPLEVSTQSA